MILFLTISWVYLILIIQAAEDKCWMKSDLLCWRSESCLYLHCDRSFTHECMLNCLVVSDSVRPHGLWSVMLLCPWNFLGKNTGADCHPSSSGSSWPRDWTPVSCIPCIGRQIFYYWDTWEALVFIEGWENNFSYSTY